MMQKEELGKGIRNGLKGTEEIMRRGEGRRGQEKETSQHEKEKEMRGIE